MNLRQTHYSEIIPKNTFYFSNGTGRDTYILTDSGGCIKHQSFSDFSKKKENFHSFNYKDHKKYYSIRKNNNITHYQSDGSGRDKYIIVNEGGLSHPFDGKNHTEALFANALRNYYNSCYSKENKDYFGKAQIFKSTKELKEERNTFKRQSNISKRLSTPKPLPKIITEYYGTNRKIKTNFSNLKHLI